MQEDKWEEPTGGDAGGTDTVPGGSAPTAPVTTSKDNNMTNKTNVTEASMNISMNGESAAEVKELIGILKNAGMPDAAPVSDMMPTMKMDPHDDMKSMMMKVDGPPESPCGMGEEDDVDEAAYSNSPDETYGTADPTDDRSTVIVVNAPKKMSKKPVGTVVTIPMESSKNNFGPHYKKNKPNEAHRGKKKKSGMRGEDIKQQRALAKER